MTEGQRIAEEMDGAPRAETARRIDAALAEVKKEERAHYVSVIDALGEVLTVASGIPEAVRANALAALEAAAQHAGTGFARELAAIRALGPKEN